MSNKDIEKNKKQRYSKTGSSNHVIELLILRVNKAWIKHLARVGIGNENIEKKTQRYSKTGSSNIVIKTPISAVKSSVAIHYKSVCTGLLVH